MEKGFAGLRLRALPFLVVELDSGVILKRGTTELLVQGDSALETVLLILASTTHPGKTPDQICGQFPEQARDLVMQLLREMMSKRLLIPAEEHLRENGTHESSEDVFYWTAGTSRKKVSMALSDLNPVIVGVNRISQRIHQTLKEMDVTGITLVDDPALRNTDFFDGKGQFLGITFGADQAVDVKDFLESQWISGCVIATTEFGSQSFLLPWNETCVRKGIHFMPVNLRDMMGYAGPLVIPGDTACLHCVRMRQNAHLRHPEINAQIESEMSRGASIAAIHPTMISILAETAVFELVHFYGALPEPRPGRLVVIDLAAGKTESNRVLKIPRCPVCSSSVTTSGVQIRRLTPLSK